MLEYTDYIKIFIALLAVLDPLASVPVVVKLTSDSKHEDLKKIVNTVIVTVLTILIVTLFIGEHLLDFFGITINSFKISGGILLMMMAISIPLLAGPGVVSAVILYAHRGNDMSHYLMMVLIIVLVVLVLWGVLASVPWISKHISRTGINVFTRLMGLIIAALAVEFIANGLKGIFPVLATGL